MTWSQYSDHLFYVFPIMCGVLCLSLFWYTLLCVLNHLEEEKRVVALLLLSYGCLVTVNFLWLFLTVPLVGLQCVIVVFPDHTQT